MRYGLPYQGSKNAIAEWIVNELPPNRYLVDLFFGGGAVTHAAMLSKKWDRFIINDIDGRLSRLFVDCAHGKYTTATHPEWISRKEFTRRKADDAYIALIWSFGNNGKDYLYGADIEEYKHAYHILTFDNDPEPLKKLGIEVKLSSNSDVYGRYLDYSMQMRDLFAKTESHERLERLESLYRLQRLQSLQSLQSDYQQVVIPEGATIYCDPPYNGTNCGKYDGFDSDRFYEWAEKQENIYISEYQMPDDFIEIARCEKTVLSAAGGNNKKAIEKLYTNKRTYNSMTDEQKERYKWNIAEQMTFF